MLLFLVGKEKHGIIFPCPFQSSSFFWGRSVTALYYCSLDRRLLLSNRLFIVQRIRTHEHMDQIQLLLRGQNVPLCVKRQTWMNTQSDLFSSTQATQPVSQIRTDSDFEYRKRLIYFVTNTIRCLLFLHNKSSSACTIKLPFILLVDALNVKQQQEIGGLQ